MGSCLVPKGSGKIYLNAASDARPAGVDAEC